MPKFMTTLRLQCDNTKTAQKLYLIRGKWDLPRVREVSTNKPFDPRTAGSSQNMNDLTPPNLPHLRRMSNELLGIKIATSH
jgi:hypothetical protein